MIKKIFSSTLFKLIIAVILGLIVGSYANDGLMNVVVTVKYIVGQLIFFMIPLIVLAFISLSIAKMGSSASKMVGISVSIAYLSSVGAALLALSVGYSLLPIMVIESAKESIKNTPPLIFELTITPVMSVMSALVLALFVGLSSVWTKSKTIITIISEFQRMVLALINRVLIPILPLFIAANFAIIGYEGVLVKQLPIFINVMVVVLIAHFVWLAILYTIGGLVANKNPFEVIKHYAPPYFTALGTMSSAATLPVSLKAAKKSTILNDKTVDFSIPLFSNIHLCGSILTEVFFVLTVSKIIYGTLPELSTMILFVVLLAIFAIGAPGVPGGTVIASLGIVTSIVGFDEKATALLLTIFALQDSFGTACNVVGDGALTMIMSRFTSESSSKKLD
ncbi:MAG: dicarboxylate/amino acid:cation symporter [Rikenellaceae bacterium]